MALMEALAPPSVLQAAPALAVGRHGARSDSSTFAGSHFVGPPGVMSAAVAVTCLASRRGARTALAAKAKKGKRSEAAARAMEALAAYEQKPAEQAEKKKKKNRRNQATMQDQEREKQKLEKLMEKDVEAPLPKAEEKIEKPVKEEPVLKPKAEEKPVEKPETQVPDVTPMTEKEPVLKEKPAALQPKETQTQAQAKKPSYFDDLLDVMAETPETDERMALPPPLEVDSDPFAVIAKEHQEHERSNGRRKIAARKKEAVDPKKYYDEKGMQDKADEWLLLNPEEEEEEEEEEVVIKRKRGPEDKVDFSFLQKGDVEGEITVGIREVAVRLGGRMVLQDASWTVKTGERLALVGANGCGKTTQLRVLTGDILPESGEVVKSHAKCKMAVLEQSFVDDLNPKNTLKEELMGAVPTVEAISQEMEEVEAELAANPEDEQEIMRLSNRLSELTDMKEDYKVDKVKEILKLVAKQVGFLEEDMDRPVNLFSGGWKVRIGVCKILMMSPDVLLLDEPTNHLDLEAVEWLEKFLRTQDLPMVIVTHDREFMNRVCTRVVETVEGMTYSYNGNYTDFVRAKEEKMTDWKKKWDLQEKKRKQLEDYIKQNRGVQSLAKARARREKDLEELLETGIDPPPSFVKRINFRFPEPPKDHRGGAKNEILAELRRVSHGYGTEDDEEYELLKDCDFMVTPGDKIGIVGGNGKGKSTLLRLLMGQERPRDGGTIRMADPEMTGFFAQHQADLLPMEKTGWEVIKEANEILMDDKKLMEIMKKFRFRGDRAHVQIANLSGGEKARLAIVRMMLIPSRMLIFDEPTNHLDVPMKETLEMALREFEGAVVMVSHDRWFLSQTCKKIVEIHDGKVTIYDGDFRFYMDSNNDIRRTIEAHYTGIDGLIESVPASLEERRKKERKGLRKNQLKKRQQERQELLNSGFLSNREWRR